MNFIKGRSNGYKIFERICPDCNFSWYPTSGGAGKRKFCEKCYPLRRQADTLYYVSKDRAEKNGLTFDLSSDFIYHKLKDVCPRTGMAFVIGQGSNYSNRHPQTPSVDKIDPSGGYTKENVQIVCWWYNSAKQRYTDEEVLEFCKSVVNSSAT